MTAAALSAEIRELQRRLDLWYPLEIATETHARRLASLRRQQAADYETLARLVTELGAAVQEAGGAR